MNIVYELKFGLEYQAIYYLRYPSEMELRKDHMHGMLENHLKEGRLFADDPSRIRPDIFSGLALGCFALSEKILGQTTLDRCQDVDLIPFKFGENSDHFYTAIVTNVTDVRDRDLIKRHEANPFPLNYHNFSFIDPSHKLFNRSMFFKMERLGSLSNSLNYKLFFARNDNGKGYNFLEEAENLGLTGFEAIEICRSE